MFSNHHHKDQCFFYLTFTWLHINQKKVSFQCYPKFYQILYKYSTYWCGVHAEVFFVEYSPYFICPTWKPPQSSVRTNCFRVSKFNFFNKDNVGLNIKLLLISLNFEKCPDIKTYRNLYYPLFYLTHASAEFLPNTNHIW